MKIFTYELHKILYSSFFLFVIIGGLSLNIYLSISSGKGFEDVPDETYRQFYSDISDMDSNEKELYLNERILDANQAYIESFELSHIKELTFFEAQLSQLNEVKNYEQYLQSIKENAEIITSVPIFSKPDSFVYRNAKKTPSAYEKMHGTELSFEPSKGILLIAQNIPADLIALFFSISAVMILFQKEKETGINALLKPLRKGGKTLALSKAVTVLIISAVSYASICGINMIIGAYRYGLGDLLRPLQSVDGFLECNFKINVITFLFLLGVLKVSAIFMAAQIWSVLCIKFSSITAAIIFILIGVAETIMYILIDINSSLSVFKHINVVGFFDCTRLFETYYNINCFSYPVNLFIASILGICLCIVVLTLLGAYLFSHINVSVAEFKYKILKINKHVFKKPLTYSLYKAFITHKGLTVILIILTIQVYTAADYRKPYDIDDDYYRYYCGVIESQGSDEERLKFIETETQKFNLLRNQFDTLTRDSEASVHIITAISDELRPQYGFETAKKQFLYISELNQNVRMFYQTGFKKLFGVGDFAQDMYLTLLMSISLCFIVSPLISFDNLGKINSIIFATKGGRKTYIKSNILTCLISAVLVSLAVNTPYFLQILSAFGTDGIECPIKSIAEFESLPFNINILGYILLLLFLRTLFCFLLTMILLFVSSRCKSPVSALLINLLVFVFPSFIYLLGADFIRGKII